MSVELLTAAGVGRRPRWHVAFAALCAIWWAQKLLSNPGNQWDFTVYYYGARAWRAGLDPYDTATLPAALGAAGFKFNYPPYALGVFAPFTLLSVRGAMLVYLAVKTIALAGLVRIWSRLVETDEVAPAWVLFLMFAYSSAIFIDFASGNVTTFEQWLVWIGIAALLTERSWTFVAAVVAASLFRLTPILLLGLCLATPSPRRYRHLAGGVAAFALIFLVTYAISPGLTVEFLQSVPKNFGERGPLNPAALPLAADLAALLRQSYHAPLVPAIEALLYVALAAAIAVPTVGTVRRLTDAAASNRLAVTLYFLLLAYALVMPRFKSYSYMLVIAPTYYIATHSTRLRQAIPLLILACLPIYTWITRAENLTLVANYSQWLIALGAWGLFMYELRGGTLLAAEAR